MMDDESPENGNVTVAGDLRNLRRFTPARIAIGRAGCGQPTSASLQFSLDHARARDAVLAAADFDTLEQALHERGWSVTRLRSAARDRGEYIRRPDLGRRLSVEQGRALEGGERGCDVAIVAADGLSALAIESNLLPVLDHLRPLLIERHLSLGPLALVEYGRVAIGDEIGEQLGAKLVIVLIGERPGLSAADSLGAYITWHPRVGTMDSRRNCISNIRPAGLPAEPAAAQIADVVARAFQHGTTGVGLVSAASGALPAT
jgi:ethanolamine ammonia-lyase small subunit